MSASARLYFNKHFSFASVSCAEERLMGRQSRNHRCLRQRQSSEFTRHSWTTSSASTNVNIAHKQCSVTMLTSVWPYIVFTTWKAAVVSWISCKHLHTVHPHVWTKLYTGLMAEYFGGSWISQDTLTTPCRSSSTEWGDYLQETRPFASPFVSIFRSSKWPWQHVLLTHTHTLVRFSAGSRLFSPSVPWICKVPADNTFEQATTCFTYFRYYLTLYTVAYCVSQTAVTWS
jgi:hypothetical protein